MTIMENFIITKYKLAHTHTKEFPQKIQLKKEKEIKKIFKTQLHLQRTKDFLKREMHSNLFLKFIVIKKNNAFSYISLSYP